MHSEILQTPYKGSELLKLTAFQLSTQSVGELPSLANQAAMPDTRQINTQPLQLVTASVNKYRITNEQGKFYFFFF